MGGLQRSVTSFRRQGSSGLIWEDRFLKEDLNQKKKKDGVVELNDLRLSHSVGSIGMMERSRSTGGGGGGYGFVALAGKVSPTFKPPSPKGQGCGFFGLFRKPVSAHKSKTKKRKP